MTCESAEKWILLSMGQIDGEDAERMREHARGCAACGDALRQARREHEKLARAYRAMDVHHEALRAELLAALPQAAPVRPVPAIRSWLAGLAVHPLRAAAVAAAAAALVVLSLPLLDLGEGVAFAQVVERLREVETLVCRFTREVPDGGQVRTATAKLYLSQEHGSRADVVLGGRTVARTFAPPGGPITSVMPSEKTYMVVHLSDQDAEDHEQKNPAALLERLRSLTGEDATSLGHRTLDGRRVKGFRITGDRLGSRDPEVSAELWVENDTGRPVRLVRSRPWTRPGVEATETLDRFEWNPSLEAAFFEPDVPDDYTLIDVELPAADEDGLIRGLRLFAELSGGRYPRTLDEAPASGELERVLEARRGESGADGRKVVQEGLVFLNACRFYALLVAEGHEPEYFGEGVRAADADRVLIRWRLDDGRLRVVYGDLRAQTLPAPPGGP